MKICIIYASIRMDIGGYIIVVPCLEVTWCTLIRYSRFVFDDILYLTRGATSKPSSTTAEAPNCRVVQRLGGGGCRNFVPVLGGNGTKTAPPGGICYQPSSEMS